MRFWAPKLTYEAVRRLRKDLLEGGELVAHLLSTKSPPYFRIRWSYIVNLIRARERRGPGERNSEIKLDPPVNKVLLVSQTANSKLRKLLGI